MSPRPTFRERAGRYSDVQRKTVATALELFADHGVGGTSIQMIADALGVTKGAVYHQFKSKDAIVVAVVEVELAGLEAALEEAASAGQTAEARDVLLTRVIDTAVERRRAASTLQNDPVLVRFLDEDEQSRKLWARLFATLLGDVRSARGRVRAAVLSAAIGSAAHPFVAKLDDDALRAELLRQTREILDHA